MSLVVIVALSTIIGAFKQIAFYQGFEGDTQNLSSFYLNNSSFVTSPPVTFVIMRRDVCNNLYHTIVWHMATLQRAAVEHALFLSESKLVFTDECRGFVDLYGALGFKEVLELATAPNMSDVPCDVNWQPVSWNDIDSVLVGRSCLFVYHTTTTSRTGADLWPKSEFGLRKDMSELYTLRHLLRARFCAEATDRSSQLVFIDRNAGSRGLLNQEEVLTQVSSLHQDVVVAQLETQNLYEQADMLCNAGIIVGMHGAAFTWLLLVSAGASVIEIFPYGWADPCYRNIARISGLSYFAIQNTNKEYHDESKCPGRCGFTRLDVGLLDAPLGAALLVSTNTGVLFSPPCKELMILSVPVPADYPCEYNFVRDTAERVIVERLDAKPDAQT